MQVKRFEIWVADLNPQIGTEPGKTRPVLIVQTNLLNMVPHPSTIICPLTTSIQKESEILRVHIKKGTANLNESCDIMIDQLRAINNKRLLKKLGELPENLSDKVKENLTIILDLY
ncbi:MAG TPA: type II toxin-antitoxin system PemK/MazF family toxin [Bacteroidales bacterium]|jgi:mRNA interferase MazF|nr:type II toxin-antitoxin system PemK/MazF family toxin [Bacteroidales bacterium]MDI9532334.1 type II toxin-antitoxin system PemK/MazF family toxin [Bacteroidota bacterium]MBP7035295.1 type II toxin-antitoxin system PemK/MazF family toxin [Bacteroidales bacterium]MBP8708484.1 type II toxin-antitoxin system PemK/MazF family toxin [Bacteroidales bacterium]HHU99566.1 type II toxin-antitoxin system PemK/MazF family toxin [Bacteroidales bacterium]